MERQLKFFFNFLANDKKEHMNKRGYLQLKNEI